MAELQATGPAGAEAILSQREEELRQAAPEALRLEEPWRAGQAMESIVREYFTAVRPRPLMELVVSHARIRDAVRARVAATFDALSVELPWRK